MLWGRANNDTTNDRSNSKSNNDSAEQDGVVKLVTTKTEETLD
jgi:hypothetical protein